MENFVGVGAHDDPFVSSSVLRDVQGPSPTFYKRTLAKKCHRDCRERFCRKGRLKAADVSGILQGFYNAPLRKSATGIAGRDFAAREG